MNGTGSPGCSKGCMGGCAVSIAGFILLAILAVVISSFSRAPQETITVSTTNRSPLPAGICVESKDWYEDNAQWITKSSQMISGLKTFYKKTGVQPYVVIASEINGKGESLTDSEAETYLEDKYNTLFNDEGHLIFLFLEYESGVYKEYLYLGNKAASVIDHEAQEIIYDYADYYYTSDLDDNAFFATVFEKSAERIMQKTTTKNDIANRTVLIVGIIVPISIIGYIIIRNKKYDLKRLEEKRKILETPIDNLADEELKNKYKD